MVSEVVNVLQTDVSNHPRNRPINRYQLDWRLGRRWISGEDNFPVTAKDCARSLLGVLKPEQGWSVEAYRRTNITLSHPLELEISFGLRAERPSTKWVWLNQRELDFNNVTISSIWAINEPIIGDPTQAYRLNPNIQVGPFASYLTILNNGLVIRPRANLTIYKTMIERFFYYSNDDQKKITGQDPSRMIIRLFICDELSRRTQEFQASLNYTNHEIDVKEEDLRKKQRELEAVKLSRDQLINKYQTDVEKISDLHPFDDFSL